MDSLDHSSPVSPPHTIFVCPKVRFSDQMDPYTYFRFFSIKKEDDPSLKELSHRLLHIKSKIPCGVCKLETLTDTDFWCVTCDLNYHRECVESPPQIKVLYHPKHPLQHHLPYWLLEDGVEASSPENNSIYNKCSCCGEDIKGFYYSCSICDFNLHPLCAIKSNTLPINNPKRHDHTLNYFPRKNSLTCDLCALSDDKLIIYICYQCDFVVHKSCIYLPTTIRIPRHDHRLSFTLCHSVSNKDSSCGVCRKRVDADYGKYSCVKGCNYVVHSKCATRRDLWDGKELEGEPEIELENIKMFEDIGDGIIKHSSHPNHPMILEKKENDIVDNEKWCQACILPIYEGGIYNCIKCDFTLHEVCAHLPGRIWHQMHAHPLTLEVDDKFGWLDCTACENVYYGFSYECDEELCPGFNSDVRCALVSEPFVKELHPHPLFLTFVLGKLRKCALCGQTKRHLTCIICEFVLCLSCATLPYKVKYRFDEHLLKIYYNPHDRRIVNLLCEICEKEIRTIGFYMCDVCSVNVHESCLFGKDPFMRQGEGCEINEVSFLVIPNTRLSRPICTECESYCPNRIAFITFFGMLFCSRECIHDFGKERLQELDQQYWRREEAKDKNSWPLEYMDER